MCNCCEKNKALPDNVWCASCMEHNSEWNYDKANTSYLAQKWSNCMLAANANDLKDAVITKSKSYTKL